MTLPQSWPLPSDEQRVMSSDAGSRQRLRLATSIVAGGAALCGALAGWPTWTVSGSATRNSYASLRAAQALGIEQLTPFRVAWFCVPVAAAALVLLLGIRAMRSAAAVGLVTAVVLVLFGGGVLLTPVADGVGPWLALGSGVVLAGGSVGLLAQGRGKD